VRWWHIAAALFMSACDLNLPSESKIEDLRILDIKVDPPEISLFELGSLALEPENLPPFRRQDVTVKVLAAHPDLDATFSFEFVRCKPGLGSIPCDDGETRDRLGGGSDNTFSYIPVDLVLADVVGGENSLDQVAARFVEDPRDLINGLYTYINSAVSVASAAITVDTPTLEGVKRVVVFEPRIIARAIQEAQKLDPSEIPMIAGLALPSLCTNVDPATTAQLFTFLSTRTPNRSPTYEKIEIEIFTKNATTATRSVGLGEVVEVFEGDVIAIEGLAAEDDAEKYQLIDADCTLQKFRERLAFSWFSSVGDLSTNVTTEEDSLVDWVAPPFVGEPLRARIWTVLRDGRGGSDHGWFDVLVRPR